MTRIVIGALYLFGGCVFCWVLLEFFMAYDMDNNGSTHAAELRSVELGLHGITHLGLSLLAVGLAQLLAKLEP